VSTLFTLFVVPCVYSIFSKFERKRYHIKFEGEVEEKEEDYLAEAEHRSEIH